MDVRTEIFKRISNSLENIEEHLEEISLKIAPSIDESPANNIVSTLDYLTATIFDIGKEKKKGKEKKEKKEKEENWLETLSEVKWIDQKEN